MADLVSHTAHSGQEFWRSPRSDERSQLRHRRQRNRPAQRIFSEYHTTCVTADTDRTYEVPAESTPPIRRAARRRGLWRRFSMSRRLDAKLLIPERSHGLASLMTRPPLLSSATRPGKSGPPDCARLTGANAQPSYGIHGLIVCTRILRRSSPPAVLRNAFGPRRFIP